MVNGSSYISELTAVSGHTERIAVDLLLTCIIEISQQAKMG
jgi:hypothetical protein